jgi:hypothetical protein
MKIRIIIFVVLLAVMAALVWWSGFEKKAHQPAMPMSQQAPMPPGSAPRPQALPLPMVASVTLAAQDDSGRSYPPVNLKLGESEPLPGTPYALRFSEFYPHWNWDAGPQNLSYDPVNPAVRVEVLKGGSVQYYAWAFQNMPFFRMVHHAPKVENAPQGQLAFTLLKYEGLKIPGHGMGGK